MAALSATMSRLTAELFGTEPKFSAITDSFPHFVSSQKLFFERRQSAKNEEIENLNAILALVQEEIQMNEPLVARGDVSKTEILRLQREEAELVAREAKLTVNIFKVLRLNTTKLRKSLSVFQLLIQRKQQLMRPP